MFVFGHLGVGKLLVHPWRKKISVPWFLLGTLTPDILDKILYYIPALTTGKKGLELGLISGTRTIGHSLLFFLLIWLLGKLLRSSYITSFGMGIATHLLLDNLPEISRSLDIHSSRIALFFPLYGWRFPASMHESVSAHLSSHFDFYYIGGEVLGILVLVHWYYSKRKKVKTSRSS